MGNSLVIAVQHHETFRQRTEETLRGNKLRKKKCLNNLRQPRQSEEGF